MIIDVYLSTKDDDKYLSVPTGTDVNTLSLPDDIDPDLLDLTQFKTALELDHNNPIVGIDQRDIEKQITKKGYALHGARLNIDLSMKGKM